MVAARRAGERINIGARTFFGEQPGAKKEASRVFEDALWTERRTLNLHVQLGLTVSLCSFYESLRPHGTHAPYIYLYTT